MAVLPRVVTRNWRLKLSALALAVFLWAIATVQARSGYPPVDLPVRVVVADSAWTLSGDPSPALVRVQLGGPTRDLLQLPRAGDIGVIRIPVDHVTSADTVVRLRPDWVVVNGAGPGITIENLQPMSITVRLEKAFTRAVPIAARTRGELAADLALEEPLRAAPTVARITGPERRVQSLDSVILEPVDLSSVRESGSRRVALDTSRLGGLSYAPQTAQVSMRVGRAIERVIPDVPVRVEVPMGLDSAAFLPRPATIQVTLRGAVQQVNQASANAITAVVAAEDLDGLPAGDEWTVRIRVIGVPAMVRSSASTDSVRVLRSTGGTNRPVVPDTTQRPPARAGVPRDTTQRPPARAGVPRDTIAGSPP